MPELKADCENTVWKRLDALNTSLYISETKKIGMVLAKVTLSPYFFMPGSIKVLSTGMIFELKRVPGDHGGIDLQLRVVQTPAGEVLAVEREWIAGAGGEEAYARAADRLLAASTDALARR